MPSGKLRISLLLSTLALATAPALADIAEVMDAEGNRMRFEYQADKLRINMDQQDAYMVVRDGRTYVVNNADGELMVIDLSQTMAMFGSMAKAATPETVDVRVESLEATGRRETVAGIDGEIYRLRYLDEDGRSQETEMVLSKDSRALGFRDAVFLMARSIADSVDMDLEGADKLQNQLALRDMGVLRYGQEMRITDIQATRVEDSRFVLPAEPTDLSGLGSLFGGGQQGNGGGLGGLFGGSQPADENDSSQQGGSAVENAGKEIGKAFGRLFGN